MNKKILLVLFIAVSFVFNGCEDVLDSSNSKEIAAGLEGHWKSEETLKSPDEVYYVDISLSDNDSTKVIISNFNALGNDYEATAKVNGYSITIPSQSLISGYSVRGSGTISSKLQQINWTYFVDDGSGVEVEFDAIYTFSY